MKFETLKVPWLMSTPLDTAEPKSLYLDKTVSDIFGANFSPQVSNVFRVKF